MKQSMCSLKLLLLLLVVCLGTSCKDTKDKTVGEITETVPSSAEEICPILVGDSVPDLVLLSVDANSFNLNEAITNKPAVLIFYRGGWCPYCNIQLGQLAQIEDEIIKAGYQIIAISPDKPEKLAVSIDKHKMNYLLLSDSSMAAAKAFKIAFKLDDETIRKYNEYGIDLYSETGQRHNLLPVPSVFVVGTDEIIKFEYVNPNYKVRLDPNILLAVVKGHQ